MVINTLQGRFCALSIFVGTFLTIAVTSVQYSHMMLVGIALNVLIYSKSRLSFIQAIFFAICLVLVLESQIRDVHSYSPMITTSAILDIPLFVVYFWTYLFTTICIAWPELITSSFFSQSMVGVIASLFLRFYEEEFNYLAFVQSSNIDAIFISLTWSLSFPVIMLLMNYNLEDRSL